MKLIEFKPTVDWANYALEKVGIDKRLEEDDCWKDAGKLFNSLSEEERLKCETIAQAVLKTNDPEHLLYYCYAIENRKDFADTLLKINNPECITYYCEMVENRPDFVAALLVINDAKYLYGYCRDVETREDFAEAILKINNPWYIYKYVTIIENREDFRNALKGTRYET